MGGNIKDLGGVFKQGIHKNFDKCKEFDSIHVDSYGDNALLNRFIRIDELIGDSPRKK